MTFKKPIEMHNGEIGCPSCITKPIYNLELPRLSYIEIPTLDIHEVTAIKKSEDYDINLFLLTFIGLIIVLIVAKIDTKINIRKRNEQ